MPCRHLFSITGITSPDSCTFSLQEPVHERECVPVKRRLCARGVQTYNDVCDVSYETICTTIIATKYVEVSIVIVTGHKRGSGYYYPAPYRAALIRDCPASFLLTDDHICNSQHQT